MNEWRLQVEVDFELVHLYKMAVCWMEHSIIELNKFAPDFTLLHQHIVNFNNLTINLYSKLEIEKNQEDIHEMFKAVNSINKKLEEQLMDGIYLEDFKSDGAELDQQASLQNDDFQSKSLQNEDECKARQVAIEDMLMNKPKITYDDVIGLEEAKKSLNEAIVMPLMYPQLFFGKRKPWTRILLYGPPGTGKSRLAQAVASKIDTSFYAISSSDILSSYLGQSEKMIRDLFKHARSTNDRSVIFMDEIDSLCRRRTNREEESVRRIKTELLHNMDGFETNDSLFILCATNCPWEIDPAFLRRFQKRVYIPLPDEKSRIKIMKLHTGDDCNLSEKDWKELGELTAGYSGSDLATLVNAALFQPVRELKNTTRWRHIGDGKYEILQQVHFQIPFINRRTTLKEVDVKILPFNRPCLESITHDLECRFEDLNPSSVCTRKVNQSDFNTCLKLIKSTVNKEDLISFEDFTSRFGVVGS